IHFDLRNRYGPPRAEDTRAHETRATMNSQEAKTVLLTKAKELSRASVSKDEIAIEQNAEMLDAIQQTADREIALDSLSRNWRTAALVSEALQRIERGLFGICA